jgi:thiamine-monophosphate kinase
MKETDIIRIMTRRAKRSAQQKNIPFESDAEIVRWGGRLLAMSLDDFSSEDMFSACRPRRLGWNVAAATMSDLLAVGADPKFFLQGVVVSDRMKKSFLEEFSSGVQKALRAYGSFLLGGDVGKGREWRFTGVSVGSFARSADRMSRRVRAEEGIIAVTGGLGDGNLDAFLGSGRFVCECRMEESRSMRGAGTACIDTSDGFMNALETVCSLNPGLRMIIDMDSIPYAHGVLSAAKAHNVPPEAFLLGGAGEYELLFFVSLSAEKHAERCTSLSKIGRFSYRKPGGIVLEKNGKRFPVRRGSLSLDPREHRNLGAYKREIIGLAEHLYRQGEKHAS